jgi:hypothetical protein
MAASTCIASIASLALMIALCEQTALAGSSHPQGESRQTAQNDLISDRIFATGFEATATKSAGAEHRH